MKPAGGIFSRRHRPFIAAFAIGLGALALCALLAPDLVVEIPAVAFFLAYLVQVLIRLPSLTARHLRASAEETDEPAPIILLVTLLAVVVAVVSMFSALNHPSRTGLVELLLAFASVITGWLTIHMMAAMHYAHLFWRPTSRADGDGKGHHGGLEFPGTPEPSGWDFVYFAYVIGMTAQTSDTAVTTTSMRRVNLLHAIVSYFFNTVLVAAAVNAAVSLAT